MTGLSSASGSVPSRSGTEDGQSAAPSPEGGLSPILEVPLERGDSKVDAIVDRLLTAIGIGEYLPGARLPSERALAESLSVSRGTVRDAIGSLVEQGVLRRKRGRDGGSFVLDTGDGRADDATRRVLTDRWQELVDLIEAGSRLHEAIVRAAAQRRTVADIADLEERLSDFRVADTGMPRQAADERLHAAIGRAAHLAPLLEALALVERQISTGSSAHLWGSVESHRGMEARALIDHEHLVALIRDGDADAAGRLARTHALIDLDLLVAVRDRRLGGDLAQGRVTP